MNGVVITIVIFFLLSSSIIIQGDWDVPGESAEAGDFPVPVPGIRSKVPWRGTSSTNAPLGSQRDNVLPSIMR